MNQLTEREKEILQLIAVGKSNKMIASELGTAEQTVKNQITLLKAKLGAGNRAHAVALAMKEGLI